MDRPSSVCEVAVVDSSYLHSLGWNGFVLHLIRKKEGHQLKQMGQPDMAAVIVRGSHNPCPSVWAVSELLWAPELLWGHIQEWGWNVSWSEFSRAYEFQLKLLVLISLDRGTSFLPTPYNQFYYFFFHSLLFKIQGNKYTKICFPPLLVT